MKRFRLPLPLRTSPREWSEPLLRSRLGRRLLLAFGLSTLVPVVALAWLAMDSVSARLRADAAKAVQRETKTAGLILAQRLRGFEDDLRMLADSVAEHEPESDLSSLSAATRARLHEQIRRLALAALPTTARTHLTTRFTNLVLERGGRRHPLHGDSTTALHDATPSATAHLEAGHQLLRFDAAAGRLQLTTRIDPSNPERGLLHGRFEPAQLADLDGIPAAEDHLLVLDENGRRVIGTANSSVDAGLAEQLADDETREGSVRWRNEAGEEIAGHHWQLFLQPRYATNWTIAHGRSLATVDSPLHGFQLLFALTAVLTVLIAVAVGMVQLRLVLQPIARLEQATRSLAAGNLDVRVGIQERDDELGDLSRSFDEMTERLSASERDLLEARDRALDAVRTESTFLSNVSHEIRTPLTGIVSSAEILRDFSDADPEAQSEFAGVILEQAHHLTRLLDDVLALSGAGTAAARLDEHRTIDLQPTLEAAIERLPASAKPRIRTDIARDLPRLRGDPEQLGQLWFQLLDNAIKFSPPREKVSLRARVIAGDLVVKVVDHGVGIAPEYHEIIFERFRQVGRDIMTDKATGTGLGLALARTIVEGHGGRIEVQSEFGIGATFKITLPVPAHVAPPEVHHSSDTGATATMLS